MRAITSAFIAVASVALLLMPVSCSVRTCYEDTVPTLNTVLLASGTGATLKADSLRVLTFINGVPEQLMSKTSASSFSVELDPTAEMTEFIIIINGTADTAMISYTRHPTLISPECGYTFISHLTGLQTTHNIIDTLIIENIIVDLNGEKNLHLFY